MTRSGLLRCCAVLCCRLSFVQPKGCQLLLLAMAQANLPKASNEHQSRFPNGFSE